MVVDLNTASRDELAGLGITADIYAILEARPFSSLDELKSFSGIGQKALDRLKKKGLVLGAGESTEHPSPPKDAVGAMVADVKLDWGRASFKGQCDDGCYMICRTNGQPYTLKWLKNAGTSRVAVFSLDAKGKIMAGTEQALDPDQTIESYTAAADARGIAFSCPAGEDETCIVEIDR